VGIEAILETIAQFIINIISSLGYFGIVLTMAIESALIPLPSEIIMPFSGFLVSTGRFNFWLVVLAGAVGNLLGSYIAYAAGYLLEAPVIRKLTEKYGKFILLTTHELDIAEKFFQKYGNLVVFGSRLLPGVRTVVSLPCGMAKLPLVTFSLLTFSGSFLWSAFLTYVGVILGENWEILRPVFRQFDIVIVVLGLVLVVWYVRRKLVKKT